MEASYQALSNSVHITDDRRSVATLYSHNRTRFIAAYVCTKLKRQPELLNSKENRYINTILGEKLSLAHRYIELFPNQDEISEEGTKFFYNKLVYPLHLSKEKCECLKWLILTNPFVITANNNDCWASNDNLIMLVHPVTIDCRTSRINVLVGNKLAAIQARTTDTKIRLLIVSKLGWVALQETISYYDSCCILV